MDAANDKNGDLVLYSSGLNNDTQCYKYQNFFKGNWSEWIPLGGNIVDISTTPYGDNGMIVFLMDPFHIPYYRYQHERGGEWADGFWSETDMFGYILNKAL